MIPHRKRFRAAVFGRENPFFLRGPFCGKNCPAEVSVRILNPQSKLRRKFSLPFAARSYKHPNLCSPIFRILFRPNLLKTRSAKAATKIFLMIDFKIIVFSCFLIYKNIFRPHTDKTFCKRLGIFPVFNLRLARNHGLKTAPKSEYKNTDIQPGIFRTRHSFCNTKLKKFFPSTVADTSVQLKKGAF